MKTNETVKPEFKAKIRKTGDSFVVTIPPMITRLWDIKEGEEIFIQLKSAVYGFWSRFHILPT